MRLRSPTLKQAVTVLWVAKPAWIFVIGTVIAIAVARLVTVEAADRVKYASGILQVFGLVPVVWGLSSLRQSFGHPSIQRTVADWFRSVGGLFVRRDTVFAVGGGAIEIKGGGRARSRVIAGPNTTLEQRVAILEQALNGLEAEQDAASAEHRKLVTDLRADFETERVARKQDHHRVETRLEAFALGGLGMEIVGLLWILLGTLLNAVPLRWAARLP